MRLADRQREFAAALLDPSAEMPMGLIGPDGRPSPRRFAVYRNNVAVALIEALQANFPATSRIVGEEFFRAMARNYATSEPPASPILLNYGEGFPDFIARFEPAASLPYLPDVARVERAWTDAYHAPDATPIDPNDLAAIPSHLAGDVCLKVHPSVRVVDSRYPALTIWRLNVAEGAPVAIDADAAGEDVLVVRATVEVEVRSMPPGGARFVNALAFGSSLSEATTSALKTSADFDLTANLVELISAGAFVGYGFAESTKDSDIETCAT